MSIEDKFLEPLRLKFESGETRNIYPREKYHDLLAKIKLLESSEKKATKGYYNFKKVNDKGNAVVATRFDQLLGKFGSNEMGICKQNLILEEKLNCETTLSVREATTHQSLSGGQGFFECTCKSKCLSNRCKCKKNGRQCNIRCHSSTTCDKKSF